MARSVNWRQSAAAHLFPAVRTGLGDPDAAGYHTIHQWGRGMDDPPPEPTESELDAAWQELQPTAEEIAAAEKAKKIDAIKQYHADDLALERAIAAGDLRREDKPARKKPPPVLREDAR